MQTLCAEMHPVSLILFLLEQILHVSGLYVKKLEGNCTEAMRRLLFVHL